MLVNQSSFWQNAPVTPLQRIRYTPLEQKQLQFYVKRDDLLHPTVSGNKWRKLKYNFLEVEKLGYDTVLTFGGAFSNHIAATAAAGKLLNIKTIGIIRGQELMPSSNATLAQAQANGMELVFVNRQDYQQKDKIAAAFAEAYVLPEGGSNALATRGVAEVMPEITEQLGYAPHFVATAVGTGGTVAGLQQGAENGTQVLGCCVLKNGQYLQKDIDRWNENKPNANIFWDAHGGGYGKINNEIKAFMAEFEAHTGLLLDPVYTVKLFFKITQLAYEGYFKPQQTIVALHTGGLQGRRNRQL